MRFNGWHLEREFGRLPLLPFDARAKTKADAGEGEEDYRAGESAEKQETAAINQICDDAAVCQQHLSNFNAYWRQAYGRGLHAGERLVTYGDVLRAYPGYRLPGGTNGWKPSTRTVSGRPAWPAPPKARVMTGTERVRLKVKRVERWVTEAWGMFGEIGGGRVRRWTLKGLRWLVVALVASCLLIGFRLTRRTRRFLYRQLAQRRARNRAGETYAPKSSYAAHLPYTWSASFRGATGEVAHRLFQLVAHERGRAALTLNLTTHDLLSVLLWAVLWAMR